MPAFRSGGQYRLGNRLARAYRPTSALGGWLVGLVLVSFGLVACSGPANARPAPVYVSIGDSYAAGYQPTSTTSGHTTRNGFAYRVADGLGTRLANFGCVGVTVGQLVNDAGCAAGALGPGGINYPGQSQAAAAVAYVKKHRAQLAAITVIIGGNDVKPCFARDDAPTCAPGVITQLQDQLTPFLLELRQAAGAKVPIIGLTYPDVFLSTYLHDDTTVASQSLTLFKYGLNPALKQAYAAIHAKFIDVTSTTGAYTPADQTTYLAPYGQIPTAVYDVCQLTFACQYGDVHPKNAGYKVISRAVLARLRG